MNLARTLREAFEKRVAAERPFRRLPEASTVAGIRWHRSGPQSRGTWLPVDVIDED